MWTKETPPVDAAKRRGLKGTGTIGEAEADNTDSEPGCEQRTQAALYVHPMNSTHVMDATKGRKVLIKK